MIKHTPAPWRVGTLPTNAGGIAIVNDDTRIAVVDMQKEVGKKRAYAETCVERDANAALIAAAPEMLSVLLDIMDNVHLPTGYSDIVVKAIQKATGEKL